MKSRSYLYAALTTTLNIVLYALTFGHFIWLEGRVCRGVFRNWIRQFRYRPQRFAQPTTEEEIINLIKNSRSLRVFGSAHSFNEGVVTDETLVSLDRYCGLVKRNDLEDDQICVKGGTRVRDVVKLLLDKDLAFEALPSHDAQSIGGILSTDVHGTGKDWGFVNESIVSLKIIDGKGEVYVCRPEDDLFKAAVGGIGAVGIISEVVVKAVTRFDVQQKFEMSTLGFVKENLDLLLQKNKHFSLYLFPFTKKCQINTWNCTDKKKSFLGPLREFVSISKDALLSAWFGNMMAYTGLLERLSDFSYSFKRGTNLVLESNKAFNRTIYHLHQELEFTVPFKNTLDDCDIFIKLYEEMYRDGGLPYGIFEIRFTPGGRNRTFIGAGREHRSMWINLVCNDSHGFEKYYAAAEKLVKEIGARPHLGKFCRNFDADDMRRIHGEHFDKFLRLVNEHDPQRKFANVFTQRLFQASKS
ncbi:MAG TPA: D-arabinono-1,4-lactone oxidase [Pyrinomonadaceae bacterium]|jgi:hypothetical protein